MGFFDVLRCHYPLPMVGANEQEFQTKSTSVQFCDDYEIRADGTLWHEKYDLEDRSNPKATGLARLAGAATRVNRRWVPENMSGELRFYTTRGGDWLEFLAEMVSGRMVALTPISPPGRRQLVASPAAESDAASNRDEGTRSNPTLYSVIEFDPAQRKYLGRIIGIPHIEILGSSLDEVESALRRTVDSWTESEMLAMETKFVALIAIPAAARGEGAAGDSYR